MQADPKSSGRPTPVEPILETRAVYLRLLFILFFPLALFASSMDLNKFYAESLVHHFQEGDCENSLRILNEWESFAPEQTVKIAGMKAAVYLAMGNLQAGRTLMDQFIQELSPEELSDPMMSFVLEIYYKTFANPSAEYVAVQDVAFLCKHEQPTGVKLRYWFGVGQILVGVIAAPFSGGASATLIFSGITTVVDATADALDNKANWEKELNDRQRMNPDIPVPPQTHPKQTGLKHQIPNKNLGLILNRC